MQSKLRILLTLWLIGLATLSIGADQTDRPPHIKEKFAEDVRVLTEYQRKTLAGQDLTAEEQVDLKDRLFSVRQEEATGDRTRNATWLIHRIVHGDDQATRLTASFVLGELHIEGMVYVEVLVPLLGSDDPQMREHAINTLDIYDHRDSVLFRNFGIYTHILQSQKNAPPDALLRYMFEHGPTEAFHVLQQTYDAKGAAAERFIDPELKIVNATRRLERQLILPDSIRQEAAQAIDDLARSPEWWARLYAAAVAKRFPDLAREETLGLLSKDEVPIVRKMLHSDEAPEDSPDRSPAKPNP